METRTTVTTEGRNEAPQYSIVIPAYEEAGLIRDTLERMRDYLKAEQMLADTEVVVVAAKGSDDTAEIAKNCQDWFQFFQVLEPGPKVGKGRDVRFGLEAANGQYLLFTDADLATPLHYIKPAFSQLESGNCDISIGVRNLFAIHKSWRRKIMSAGANWMVRLLLLPHIPDSQCGFKAFTRPAFMSILPRLTINGWAFDMEILAIADADKMRICKLEITDWADPKLEQGLVGESPIQASMNTLKELFKIRRQRAKGMYR